MKNTIKEIAGFIVKQVQEESMSGFQYIVSIRDIKKAFGKTIDPLMALRIKEELEFREEVADVQLDEYGFDVVLCTDFAPNYVGEEESEELE